MDHLIKTCTGCGEVKSLDYFFKCTSLKGGYHSCCKECSNKRTMASKYKRVYGIDKEEYQLMFEAQEGCCAICNKPDLKYRLAVDHCHNTGAVRGLLCRKCNSAIGLLGDDVDIVINALSYLKLHKEVTLGSS